MTTSSTEPFGLVLEAHGVGNDYLNLHVSSCLDCKWLLAQHQTPRRKDPGVALAMLQMITCAGVQLGPKVTSITLRCRPEDRDQIMRHVKGCDVCDARARAMLDEGLGLNGHAFFIVHATECAGLPVWTACHDGTPIFPQVWPCD